MNHNEFKKKLKLGVIGLGRVAELHLRAFQSLDYVRIISVCDVDSTRAQEVANRLNAQPYSNYQDLINAGDIDLAVILTPASSHRDVVEASALAGFHVLCEKPMAVTVADGEAMVSACKHAGVKLFYGSSYRHLPAIIKAREIIQLGEIGNVMLLSEQLIGGNGLESYKQLNSVHYPHGGPGGPGMGLVDHGIHLIDIFPWMIDSAITSIHGKGQISGATAETEFAVMTFANGAVGSLLYNSATFNAGLPNEGMFSEGEDWLIDSTLAPPGLWADNPSSMSIYGTEGALRIYHYANKLFLRSKAGVREITLNGRPPFWHFATQLDACAQAIWRDEPATVSGEEGLRALSALLSIYASASSTRG